MKPGISLILLCLSFGFLALNGRHLTWADEPTPPGAPTSTSEPHGEEKPQVNRVTLAVARDRAQVLQEVYRSTLDVMHHRYFHGDRAVVPARAMEDVFKDMKQQSQMEARWISVNLKAMSLDHEPKSDFEKHSVRQIKAGQRDVETIEDGFYRRTVAIPLFGGCLHCHEGFGQQSTSAKFAGLVISVPVLPGEELKPSGE